jgi:hypothetical protein
MATKLTLSIDKDVIEQSKRYAASQNRSLSDLIESYLRTIAIDPGSKVKITSKIKSLKGSFKAPADLDYQKVLREEIIHKHG